MLAAHAAQQVGVLPRVDASSAAFAIASAAFWPASAAMALGGVRAPGRSNGGAGQLGEPTQTSDLGNCFLNWDADLGETLPTLVQRYACLGQGSVAPLAALVEAFPEAPKAELERFAAARPGMGKEAVKFYKSYVKWRSEEGSAEARVNAAAPAEPAAPAEAAAPPPPAAAVKVPIVDDDSDSDDDAAYMAAPVSYTHLTLPTKA